MTEVSNKDTDKKKVHEAETADHDERDETDEADGGAAGVVSGGK